MKTLLIICFTFLYFNSVAQYFIKDNQTQNPVEFASVYYINQKTGTYSNKDGSFRLNVQESDTLIISCIGYYADTITKFSKVQKDIFLLPKIYDLGEVVYNVNPKSKEIELGYHKEKDKITFYSHIGSEWVVFINNSNPVKKKIIESIIIKTHNLSKHNIGYRIHIYNKDSLTGLPGTDIANLDVFNTNSHKGKKYDLDKPIVFPSTGIFVGIEWVSYLNENNEKIESKRDLELSVPLTFNLKESLTYFRSKFYDNKWILAKNNHPLSQIQNKKNPPNLAISVIVKELINQ